MAESASGKLADVSSLLDSLDEVDSYIVTDMEGRVHTASAQNINENTINSCIYLWVTGSQLGHKFNMGEPANLIYYLKDKKRLVQKYNDYIIILNLVEAAKLAAFKKKLYELLNR